MKKLITNTVFALIGLTMFAFTAQAQTPPATPPAGTPYITMTVTNNAQVQIKMQAAADNTPVWVETAAGNYTLVTVGTSWTDPLKYTAAGTTITIHGNLKGFNCNYNYTKLTGLTFSDGLTNLENLYCYYNSLTTLDVSGLTNLIFLYCYNNSLTTLDVSKLTNLTYLDCSNNSLTALNVSRLTNLGWLYCNNNALTTLDVSGLTKLKSLNCSDNNFSTQAIDNIYCGLPERQTSDNAAIYPVLNSSSANHATVLATNKQNAIDKHWAVQYYSDNTDIPATSGSYVCGTPYAGTPYITMTVTNNAQVQIKMQAAAANTPVWVETAAGNYTLVTLGTGWTDPLNYTATGTTITIHGNLKGFNCWNNGNKLTGLTFSSGLTNLENLYCSDNSLTSLNVSGLTNLISLYCPNNSLTALNVSGLTNLGWLNCFNNSLTTLNVSGLTNLTYLACSSNSLTALNVSGLTKLTKLHCSNNNFSTQAIDDIYCALPQRQTSDNAKIYPVYNSSSANHATILRTNKQNAIAKNWEVQYAAIDTDIPATTGSYVCGTPYAGTPTITMTVTNNAQVIVTMIAAADNTPVWVETAPYTYTQVTVDTSGTSGNYTATGNVIKIHGNLKEFTCSNNGNKLTGLTFSSGLTNLENLFCEENSIATLNVSELTNLKELSCDNNSLTALNVSGLTNLEYLNCKNNSLTALDVSGLTNLEYLNCNNNSLTSLNVSGLTNLEKLYCYNNFLTSLNVSGLTNLKKLSCCNNNFSTQAIDDIYCGLPERDADDDANIYPIYNTTSADTAIVRATNKQNAIDKKWKVQYAATGGDIPATSGTYVCGTPYAGTPTITMTVTNNAQVSIHMMAAAANTPVWVETAPNTYIQVTVGTSWTDLLKYTAAGTVIKVHGNLKGFSCNYNYTKLTGLTFSDGLTNLIFLNCYYNSLTTLDVSGLTNLIFLNCYYNSLTTLDVSGLTNLKKLVCYNNHFSTQAIDDIYCGLPQRTEADYAVIYPIYNSTSADTAVVFATNKQNAIDKKWKVQYAINNTDIPATTGSYVCGSTPPLYTPYITMTVTKDSTVKINMQAAADDTPVWIETSAGSYTPVTVGTSWTGPVGYTAAGTVIKVHGNLTGFDCGNNYPKLTGLTFSSGLTNLEGLGCYNNSLTTLDVSGLTNLIFLSCFNNSLTTLDVSGLTNLQFMWCYNNALTALDISGLTNLKELPCHNNNFSTQAIDDIYCGLPQRTIADDARIYPIYNSTSADTAVVFATNKQNAIDKKWAVRYYSDNTDIPKTIGKYSCPPPAGTPYITMTVTNNAQVSIKMQAAAANTPVWVETSAGSYTPVTVGTSWTGLMAYTATGTVIKVHGNLKKIDCRGNGTKLTGLIFSDGLTNLEDLYCNNNSLTALNVNGLTNLTYLHCYSNSLTTLDVSGLTKLKFLNCHGNNFSTQAIDNIYCGLPERQTSDNAAIYPVLNSSSANHATVLATNKQNAIDKHWAVQYYSDNTDIPATSGSYVCGTPYAGTPTITMTVTNNAQVSIKMQAAAANTPVWIETSAGSYTPVTVGTSWTGFASYAATGTVIKVHGNLTGFDCRDNGTKLTGLTFSSGLTNLEGLGCNNNSLTTLDVSGLTNLKYLYCSMNSLTTLDVSGLTNLKKLHCYNNHFSTQAIDDIYCGIPQRDIADNAVICPLYNSTSADTAVVFATNKQNAIDKKWKVQYAVTGGGDIPNTTGSYVCGTPYAGTPTITMTVTNNATVSIKMQAAADNTPVWVETAAGNYTQVTVDTEWTGLMAYAATDTVIKVHGNLKGFRCNDNTTKITGLTFSSGLTNLGILYCYNNSITTLNVSGLTNLEDLSCYNNSLTTLDVSGLTNLKYLSCSNNSLTTLDVSELTNLTYLSCDKNSLTTLDVSELTNLQFMWCYNNSLTSLDVSGLTNLTYLHCYNNSLTSLDVSGLTNLEGLYCSNNSLTTLDVSGLTNLKELYCSDNSLTTLNVSGLMNLKTLVCSNNSLTALNVSGLTNLKYLHCYNNSLTTLDVSGLTNLTHLHCYNNNFSTQAIDDIYCGLPQRDIADNAVIYPIYDSTSADTAVVFATNKQNAIDKKWKVQYAVTGGGDIPNTSGSYVCGTPYAGTPTITMTVTNNAQVSIHMKAAAANTPVWIETAPDNYTQVTVGTNYTTGNYTATGTTIKVHGNLERFSCWDNGNKLTGLTFSNGLTNLEGLYCYNNSLTTLDVSGLTNLQDLDCNVNSLTTLDVSGLTNLTYLHCYNNSLTSLNVSGLTNLTVLFCGGNSLTTLNVNGLTNLQYLLCSDNSLTTLDVSGLDSLKWLECSGNNFSTQAIDDIYCSLPQRQISDDAEIFPVYNSSSANHAIVMATNKQNAINKNWNVKYSENDTDIPGTTGSYACGTGIADIAAAEQLSIYPNPAKDMVAVELSQSYTGMLQITDISGKMLISRKINGTHASVDVSTLSKGMYFVKVGSKVEKLIIK